MDTALVDRLRRLAAELTGIADHVDVPDGSSDDPLRRAEVAVTRFLDLVDAGDLAALDDVVHADVVYVVPGRSRASGMYEGTDAMRRAMSVLPRHGVGDLRSKLTDLVVSADRVVTFHELTGTVDGESRTVDLALRFTLRDGRIAEVLEYSGDQYTTDDVFG